MYLVYGNVTQFYHLFSFSFFSVGYVGGISILMALLRTPEGRLRRSEEAVSPCLSAWRERPTHSLVEKGVRGPFDPLSGTEANGRPSPYKASCLLHYISMVVNCFQSSNRPVRESRTCIVADVIFWRLYSSLGFRYGTIAYVVYRSLVCVILGSWLQKW